MKNKIYYLGIISILFILTGCLFKLLHWPGAGILLTFGMSFFCLVFLPIAFRNSFSYEGEPKNRFLYIVAYLSILIIFTSALFKIMHWPGAGELLLIGIPLPFILFLPVYLVYNRNEKEINYQNFVAVMFFFAYFAAISALLSVNVGKDIIDETVIAAYHFDQKKILCEDLIKASSDEVVLSEDSISVASRKSFGTLKSGYDQFCKTIDEVEVDLVERVNDVNKNFIGQDGKIDLWKITGKESNSPILSNTDNALKIKNQIENFRQMLLDFSTKRTKEKADYIEQLLNTNDDGDMPWEYAKFFGQNMISSVTTLNMIKYDAALAFLAVVSVND